MTRVGEGRGGINILAYFSLLEILCFCRNRESEYLQTCKLCVTLVPYKYKKFYHAISVSWSLLQIYHLAFLGSS